MKIIFKTLTLKNFKGILGEKTINFCDTVTSIYGANHTGKTTVIDAILWVLFDKNSEGASVFGIDTKDENNNVIPKLEHCVKLTLSVDGVERILEKVRKDVWSKPRGQKEEVLSGHTTNYFISGNKYTQTEYKAEIANILPEALFKCITNPMFFPTLPPTEQRMLLEQMVGETNFVDVVSQKKEWALLEKYIENGDIERFRENLAYKIKGIKEELKLIPSRISEHTNELAELQSKDCDFPILEKRIAEIEKGLQHYDDMLADASKGSDEKYKAKMAVRKQMQVYEAERDSIIDKIKKENREAEQLHESVISSIEDTIAKQRKNIRDANVDAQSNERRKELLEKQKSDFRTRWQQVEDETFQWDEANEVCPTCHQRLPQEDINSLRERLQGNFNESKAKKQDLLDVEAKEIAKQQASIEEESKRCAEEKQKAEEKIAHLEKELEKAKGTQPEKKDYTTDSRVVELTSLIKGEEDKLQQLEQEDDNTTQQEAINRIREQKQGQQKLRDQLRDQLQVKLQIERKEKRIAELTTEQQTLSQQLTDLEQQDNAAMKLVQFYIEELEKKVNKMFDIVKFTMFEHHLNGNIKTKCECTMHGTPYQDLSNSEKINAGIDIINAMCRHRNAFAPIIIDNAESITDILPTASQQIRLVVSAQDKELTVVNS
ncbi:MAG: AAA family ATPase [Prevotella pallens]|uniref:AAA family ATPase n=1 Tax=Prevotella pallens TaxID=60133 RepID=UPI001CB0270A|nr:AAA family ATPase [Prevotella pallens]MBF1490678.1 AAA family ATPase [Prevotella pallens]